MLRLYFFALIIVWVANSCLVAQSPFPAQAVQITPKSRTLKQLIAEVAQQSGLVVDLRSVDGEQLIDGNGAPRTLWETLDWAAAKTGNRLVPVKNGSELRLIRSVEPTPPASHDGPFRLSVRQIVARRDFELGQTVYDLGLDLHWEPRYPVFRIESDPQLTQAETDAGVKLPFTPNRTKIPLSDSRYQPNIRLSGIPRSAKSLTLRGEYKLTAAEKMLNLSFPFAKLPAQQQVEGVFVTLIRAEKIDNRVEIELGLEYPKDHPEFESFETFVTRNQAGLTGPNAIKWDPTDSEISSQGRRVQAVYRFLPKPGTPLVWEPAKWTLIYRTPGPLREFTVRFGWTNILLP